MRKLKLFVAACALFGASATGWAQEAGTYYLQNVSNGKWLGPANDWGTQASVINHPDYWKLAKTEDGAYTLESVVTNGGQSYYLTGTFCDGASTKFTFTQVSGNVYNIQNASGNYLTTNGTIVDVSGTDGSAEASQWKLWSEDDMAAGMEAATATEPFDATYLIKDHNLERNNRDVSAWNISGATNPKTSIGNEARQRWSIESYHAVFDVNQTLSDIPNGVYALSVNGFYRNDDGGALPVLYANDESTTLPNRGSGTENNMQDAAVAFIAGNYLSDPVLIEVTDGTLKIGVKTTGTGCWVIFKNFHLAYYGDASMDEIKNAALIQKFNEIKDKAQTFDLTQNMATATKEKLQTALTNYSNPASDTESLNAAIQALTEAVDEANASVNSYTTLHQWFAVVDNELKNTNVYDAAAYETIKSAYANNTLPTAEAQALIGDRYTTLYSKLFSHSWKIGEKDASEAGSGFYMNNWSTEGKTDGTGMITPFYEYWVWDGAALGATTLTRTISGLEAGATYNVSLLVRVRQQNDQTKADDDVTLSLNGGEPINMADGSVANNVFFYKTVNSAATADAEGNILVTINVKDGNHISWLSFKNLMYSNDLSALEEQFAQLKEQAQTAISNSPEVTGSELTALNEAANATPSDFNSYSTAITALEAALNTFNAATPNYKAFAAEKTYAQDLGLSSMPADPTSAAEVTEAINVLKVAEHDYVIDTYTTDASALFIASWDKQNFDALSNEHWSATTHEYFDKWSGSAFTSKIYKTVTLPEGHYAFMAAARGQAGASTATLKVTIGSETKSVPCTIKGNRGFGINTNGDADFSAESTYACSNAGFGWEWRQLTFDLDTETEVTLAIECSGNNSWVSAGDTKLLTYDNAAIIQQLVSAEVEKAKALVGVNIGDKAFQIPSSTAAALNSAISTAENVSSDSEVESAIAALQQAEKDFQNAELNQPADGQLFNIILTYGGWTYDNKAMTYLANARTDGGLYNIQYKEAANQNLAQAFTFTHVEGNNYKLSQIDADGIVRYLSTGVPYGGNTSQIRTTTSESDALVVTVIPTATEGVWNLRNTEAKQYIGSQDAGVYTVNSHIGFKLVETSKASVAVNTSDAGWGTIIAPFAVSTIPSGVKVYSCAAVDGKLLTLTEVTALEANKPYIVEGSWNETLTGDAQGTELTYTDGLLTGVYAKQAAKVDTYVMQNNTDGVGFYKVASGKEPTIEANHAYLTVNSSARAFLFDDATAIKAIEALANGEAEIFNAAGARVQGLQKGVNIIKTGNKTMKVMVK